MLLFEVMPRIQEKTLNVGIGEKMSLPWQPLGNGQRQWYDNPYYRYHVFRDIRANTFIGTGDEGNRSSGGDVRRYCVSMDDSSALQKKMMIESEQAIS